MGSLGGEDLEHGGIRAAPGLCFFHHPQVHLIEENLGELLGGVDIELPSGGAMDLGLELIDLRGQADTGLLQTLEIEGHSLVLHIGKHAQQRHLELVKELPETFRFELRRQQFVEPPGDVGIFSGVFRDLVELDLEHGDLLLPLADQVADGDGLQSEEVTGESIHRLGAALGSQQVGGDHGVEGDALQLDSGLAQHDEVVFDVLPAFADGRILQDGPESLECGVRIEGVSLIRPQGEIPALALLPGEGEPDELAVYGVNRGRLGVDREEINLLQLREEALQVFLRVDQAVVARDRLAYGLLLRSLCGAVEPGEQAPETELLEARLQVLEGHLVRPAGIQVKLKIHLSVQGYQPAGEVEEVSLVGDVFTHLWSQLIDMLPDSRDRAVFMDEGDGLLGADSGNPGDVVGRVAGQGLDLHGLLRGVALVLEKVYRIGDEVLLRVPHLDLVGQELVEVLVLAHDPELDLFLLEQPSDRGDDVVSLLPLHLEGGDAHDPQQLLDSPDLGTEIFRRGIPVGLVLWIEIAALGARVSMVERDGEVVGLPLFENPEHHLRKDIGGLGGLAIGRVQLRPERSVIGPEDLGVTVDEVECFQGNRVAGGVIASEERA